MPILSPYSGRYVGYGIERGKLDVRLDYQIDGRRLKAKNHFELERLRFGKKTKEARTLGLPVPLAMALMRDSKGQVTIDLPIEGNLGRSFLRCLRIVGQNVRPAGEASRDGALCDPGKRGRHRDGGSIAGGFRAGLGGNQ